MTAKFLGRGNGVVITCNHNTAPYKDADGDNCFHEEKCDIRQSTGNILRSVNRKHAVANGWHSAIVAGKLRDFCPTHSPWWKEHLAGQKAAAAALRNRKSDEKAAKESARKAAWAAKQAGWKQKREEREAAKRARAAARAA